MNVEPVPFEPTRFWVTSESRSIEHLVDLQYRPEPWNKAVPFCGCERMMCGHSKTCKHIEEVVAFELKRIAK